MTTPSDSPDRWQRLWQLFHAALDREPAGRAAFLDAACGDDLALRQEVNELLTAHESEAVVDTPLHASDSPPALAAGDRLASRFRIVRPVGSGGMGTVYEAVDEELDTTVAIKTLHPDVARNSEALERFRREVLLARRVTHPNACRLFDLFHHHPPSLGQQGTSFGEASHVEGSVAFLTMELLRGETLAERLARTGPLSESEAKPIVEQVAAALAAAHRVGVVHRDLKSANVVLVAEGEGEPAARAVVTDFGLAALTAAIAESGRDLTRSGQLLGTPAFMAPEQLEGGTTSTATDIYALGLLMYEMVTGDVPFADASPLTIAVKRLHERAPSPRVRRPDLSAEWNAAILRCLERDPADRFATPDAVVAALTPGSSRARIFLPRRVRRRAVVAAVSAAAAVALGSGVLWFRSDRARGAAAMAFNERDWVLVADFENGTGEAVLDDTIRFALARELNTSQFVNVVPRERVADALRLMKRADDTSVSGEVAREVCLRDGGIRALVRGRIDKLGGTYVASVELVEPTRGVVVASLAEEARGQEEILAAVRQLSNRLRTAVGEELSRIQQANQKLAQVTTPSLRALQLYSRADAVIAHNRGDAAAEELLKQAVEEDPEFASAYIHLAHAIVNQGRRDEALRYATRAMELSTGVGEGERQFIRGGYYSMSGDYERALASYQALVQLYPDHFWGTTNAAMMLSFGLLRGEDAVPYFVRAAELRPNDFMANRNTAWNIAVRGNNLAAAGKPIARARALLTPELAKLHGSAATWVEIFPAHERWLNGDVQGAYQELQRLQQRLETHAVRSSMAYQMLQAYESLGRYRDAHAMVNPPALSIVGLVTAFLRDDQQVLNRWKALPPIPESLRGTLGGLGPIILARLGLPHVAKTAMPRARTDRTTASIVFDHVFAGAMSIVRGEVALAEGKTAEAIALIEQGLPAERLTGSAVYFLGAEALASAWLKQKNPDAAIAVLENAWRQKARAIQGSGAFWTRTVWQLAKVYRQVGRHDEAAKIEAELRDLLAMADADHPILVEMQRRGAGATTP